MKRINDPRVLPGEALYELPNGQVRLVMRSGQHSDWTVSEWDEYINDYNENLSMVDRIDYVIDSLRGRDLAPTSEVVDALLDLRVKAQQDYETHKRLVGEYLRALHVLNDDGDVGILTEA